MVYTVKNWAKIRYFQEEFFDEFFYNCTSLIADEFSFLKIAKYVFDSISEFLINLVFCNFFIFDVNIFEKSNELLKCT